MTIEQTLKDERLLALPDVCAKLSVSKTTVYELTKHCKIKQVKVLRSSRWTQSSVDEYIEQLKSA